MIQAEIKENTIDNNLHYQIKPMNLNWREVNNIGRLLFSSQSCGHTHKPMPSIPPLTNVHEEEMSSISHEFRLIEEVIDPEMSKLKKCLFHELLTALEN